MEPVASAPVCWEALAADTAERFAALASQLEPRLRARLAGEGGGCSSSAADGPAEAALAAQLRPLLAQLGSADATHHSYKLSVKLRELAAQAAERQLEEAGAGGGGMTCATGKRADVPSDAAVLARALASDSVAGLMRRLSAAAEAAVGHTAVHAALAAAVARGVAAGGAAGARPAASRDHRVGSRRGPVSEEAFVYSKKEAFPDATVRRFAGGGEVLQCGSESGGSSSCGWDGVGPANARHSSRGSDGGETEWSEGEEWLREAELLPPLHQLPAILAAVLGSPGVPPCVPEGSNARRQRVGSARLELPTGDQPAATAEQAGATMVKAGAFAEAEAVAEAWFRLSVFSAADLAECEDWEMVPPALARVLRTALAQARCCAGVGSGEGLQGEEVRAASAHLSPNTNPQFTPRTGAGAESEGEQAGPDLKTRSAARTSPPDWCAVECGVLRLTSGLLDHVAPVQAAAMLHTLAEHAWARGGLQAGGEEGGDLNLCGGESGQYAESGGMECAVGGLQAGVGRRADVQNGSRGEAKQAEHGLAALVETCRLVGRCRYMLAKEALLLAGVSSRDDVAATACRLAVPLQSQAGGIPEEGADGHPQPQVGGIPEGGLKRANLQGSPRTGPISEGDPHRGPIPEGSPRTGPILEGDPHRGPIPEGSPHTGRIQQGCVEAAPRPSALATSSPAHILACLDPTARWLRLFLARGSWRHAAWGAAQDTGLAAACLRALREPLPPLPIPEGRAPTTDAPSRANRSFGMIPGGGAPEGEIPRGGLLAGEIPAGGLDPLAFSSSERHFALLLHSACAVPALLRAAMGEERAAAANAYSSAAAAPPPAPPARSASSAPPPADSSPALPSFAAAAAAAASPPVPHSPARPPPLIGAGPLPPVCAWAGEALHLLSLRVRALCYLGSDDTVGLFMASARAQALGVIKHELQAVAEHPHPLPPQPLPSLHPQSPAALPGPQTKDWVFLPLVRAAAEAATEAAAPAEAAAAATVAQAVARGMAWRPMQGHSETAGGESTHMAEPNTEGGQGAPRTRPDTAGVLCATRMAGRDTAGGLCATRMAGRDTAGGLCAASVLLPALVSLATQPHTRRHLLLTGREQMRQLAAAGVALLSAAGEGEEAGATGGNTAGADAPGTCSGNRSPCSTPATRNCGGSTGGGTCEETTGGGTVGAGRAEGCASDAGSSESTQARVVGLLCLEIVRAGIEAGGGEGESGWGAGSEAFDLGQRVEDPGERSGVECGRRWGEGEEVAERFALARYLAHLLQARAAVGMGVEAQGQCALALCHTPRTLALLPPEAIAAAAARLCSQVIAPPKRPTAAPLGFRYGLSGGGCMPQASQQQHQELLSYEESGYEYFEQQSDEDSAISFISAEPAGRVFISAEPGSSRPRVSPTVRFRRLCSRWLLRVTAIASTPSGLRALACEGLPLALAETLVRASRCDAACAPLHLPPGPGGGRTAAQSPVLACLSALACVLAEQHAVRLAFTEMGAEGLARVGGGGGGEGATGGGGGGGELKGGNGAAAGGGAGFSGGAGSGGDDCSSGGGGGESGGSSYGGNAGGDVAGGAPRVVSTPSSGTLLLSALHLATHAALQHPRSPSGAGEPAAVSLLLLNILCSDLHASLVLARGLRLLPAMRAAICDAAGGALWLDTAGELGSGCDIAGGAVGGCDTAGRLNVAAAYDGSSNAAPRGLFSAGGQPLPPVPHSLEEVCRARLVARLEQWGTPSEWALHPASAARHGAFTLTRPPLPPFESPWGGERAEAARLWLPSSRLGDLQGVNAGAAEAAAVGEGRRAGWDGSADRGGRVELADGRAGVRVSAPAAGGGDGWETAGSTVRGADAPDTVGGRPPGLVGAGGGKAAPALADAGLSAALAPMLQSPSLRDAKDAVCAAFAASAPKPDLPPLSGQNLPSVAGSIVGADAAVVGPDTGGSPGLVTGTEVPPLLTDRGSGLDTEEGPGVDTGRGSGVDTGGGSESDTGGGSRLDTEGAPLLTDGPSLLIRYRARAAGRPPSCIVVRPEVPPSSAIAGLQGALSPSNIAGRPGAPSLPSDIAGQQEAPPPPSGIDPCAAQAADLTRFLLAVKGQVRNRGHGAGCDGLGDGKQCRDGEGICAGSECFDCFAALCFVFSPSSSEAHAALHAIAHHPSGPCLWPRGATLLVSPPPAPAPNSYLPQHAPHSPTAAGNKSTLSSTSMLPALAPQSISPPPPLPPPPAPPPPLFPHPLAPTDELVCSVTELLSLELPQIASTLRLAGVSPALPTRRWLRQCWINVLPWHRMAEAFLLPIIAGVEYQMAEVFVLPIIAGVEYQVFLCVAAWRHLGREIARRASSGDLLLFLLLGDALEGFEPCAQVEYMGGLARRHGARCARRLRGSGRGGQP